MTERTKGSNGARAIGVVLWWIVATVVAPVAAVVTAVAFPVSGISRDSTVFAVSTAVAVVVPVTVVTVLVLGARRLARGGGPAAGTRMLRAHLAVVLVLTAAFLAALVVAHVEDFGSVGNSLLTAIGGLPLLGFGAPWTLLRGFLMPDGSESAERIAFAAAFVGPALLNVGLHAVVLRLVRRRRGTAGTVLRAV